MGRVGQKFFMRLALSAVAAVATPAIAAGLVTGASVATSAGTDAISSVVGTDGGDIAGPQDQSANVATHGPAQLSVLAGNGNEAWQSVHSVHVVFPHRPH